MTIEEQVIKIVIDLMGSGNEITLETPVLNFSGIGEDFQRDFVMQVEEDFNIQIPDEEAEKLIKIKDVVGYIKKIKEIRK